MQTLRQGSYTRFSMVTKLSHTLGATQILQNFLLIKVSTYPFNWFLVFNPRQPYKSLLIAVHDQMWRIERKLHVIFLAYFILIASFLCIRGPSKDYWCLSSIHATTYVLC